MVSGNDVDSNGGTEVAEQVVREKTTAKKPTDPTKTGYDFNYWALEGEEFDFSTPITQSISLLAVWSPAQDTEYTVKHLKQNLDLNGYTEVQTDTKKLTGTTGSLTNAEAKSYAGFTAQAFEQLTINGDGTTVVEIKYNRNSYTVTFDANGGSAVESQTAIYGGKLQAVTTEKANYVFVKWTFEGEEFDITADVVSSDMTLVAEWREIDKVEYTVNHAQEMLDGTYAIESTEKLYDYQGELTNAAAKVYEGFTAQSFDQVAINADGSTVVEIKYNRNTYTVTFDADGGSEVAPQTVKYGATIDEALISSTNGLKVLARWMNGENVFNFSIL